MPFGPHSLLVCKMANIHVPTIGRFRGAKVADTHPVLCLYYCSGSKKIYKSLSTRPQLFKRCLVLSSGRCIIALLSRNLSAGDLSSGEGYSKFEQLSQLLLQLYCQY